jgi:hypothetical protein
MLKKHFALALVGTALATSPVLAQSSSSTSPSTAPAPSAAPMNSSSQPMNSNNQATPPSSSSSTMSSPSAMSSSSASAATTGSSQFLTQEAPDQWRASKLVGVDVYGPNDEKVGDINDVLISHDGKVAAVVIGVGGFLGIGEKNVALPYASLQWSEQPRTGRSSTGAGTTANTTTHREYPDHATLAMSKDDLKNAPDFKWGSDADKSSSSTSSSTRSAAPSGSMGTTRP